jgi:hypothetical protein
MDACWLLFVPYFAKQPNQENATEAQQRNPPEDVNKCPQKSLSPKLAIEHALRGMQRV